MDEIKHNKIFDIEPGYLFEEEEIYKNGFYVENKNMLCRVIKISFNPGIFTGTVAFGGSFPYHFDFKSVKEEIRKGIYGGFYREKQLFFQILTTNGKIGYIPYKLPWS